MDQFKQYMTVAIKYHFWILCGAIMLLFIGTWFVATGQMSDVTQSRVSAINSAYSQGESIVGVTNHPNDKSAAMMEVLNQGEAIQVKNAWELRYREQEDVLKWPVELLPDFIAKVEDLKPIELKVEYPTAPENELPPDLLGRYRNYIENELPELAKVIGAQWQSSGAPATGGYGDMMGGGDFGEDGSMEDGASEGDEDSGLGDEYDSGASTTSEDESVIVAWNSANQNALQQSRFAWASTPTTLQVLYAQEDLWVLHALMKVIKKTNGDADAQYNAAIKEIVSIELGATARGIKEVGGVGSISSGSSGGESFYGSGDSEGEGEADAGDPGAAFGSGSGSGSSPYSSDGATATGADPAENRYVDADNEPMSGSKLRTSMKSDAPTDAFLVVAKRMPLRVRFKMNVLKLPLLLSECAQSSLPVEVRQVRINAPAGGGPGAGGLGGGFGEGSDAPSIMGAGAGTGGAGASLGAPGDDSGGSGGGFGSGGFGSGGFGSGGFGSGGFGSGGGSGMEDGLDGSGGAPNVDYESPYDAEVEIYGVIYIYNPVNPKKLGLPDDEDAGTTDQTAGPTTSEPATPDAASSTPGAGGNVTDGAAAASSSP